MDILEQVRTPQGRFPVSGVSIVAGSGAAGPMLSFTFADPRDIASGLVALDSAATLFDLAFLTRETLEDTARAIGPLFGAASAEPVLDWQSAAETAHAVMLMQASVNATRPIELLDVSCSDGGCVAKTEVFNAATGASFSMYAASFRLYGGAEGPYARCMPSMPWLRRFSETGRFDYVLASVDAEPGEDPYLSLVLMSFDREIAPSDFAAVLLCSCRDESVARHILSQVRGDVAFMRPSAESDGATVASDEGIAADAAFASRFNLLDCGEGLEVAAARITEADAPSIAKLVQAAVSLHVQDVAVDVFRSSDVDGFLIFGSHLAYLWYGFSRKLGTVKVGYCQQCGRAFSLAGHRGIARRFCCESCKTDAKNERQRLIQADIRRRFMEGETVPDIACACFPVNASSVGCKKVLASLSTWVELRHRIDDALAEGDDALLRRCVAEGVMTAEDAARRLRAVKRRRR